MKPHYPALDGLRGIAAVAVAVYHLRTVLGIPLGLDNAPLAVDFFFMLSGFVLAHGYSDSLNAGNAFQNYLLRRVIRLYPLVVLGTVIGALAHAVPCDLSTATLIRLTAQGAVLVPELGSHPDAATFMALDPPAWSLFFEMVASVLFGLGLWRGRLRIALSALAVSGCALAWAALHYGSFDTGWSYDSIGAGMARVGFAFGLGVVLHRAHRSGVRAPVKPGFWSLASIFGLLIFSGFSSLAFQFFCVFVLFPIILLAAAEIQGKEPVAFNRWSGEISFPLYILHWPVYLWVGIVAARMGFDRFPVLLAATALLSAGIVAVVAYLSFDRPVRRWLASRLELPSGPRELGVGRERVNDKQSAGPRR